MKIENCKGCDHLGIPTNFTGIRNGVAQYSYNENEEFCSCCHPSFNGGVQLASISECPEKKYINISEYL